MKKIVLALVITGLGLAGVQRASAGDREWATAGKILTGVVAGSILAHSVAHVHADAYVTPTVTHYYAPPVVHTAPVAVYPRPVVVHPAPVVVHRPPVIVRPAPVVTYHFSYGHHGYQPYHHKHHHKHHRICR